MAPTFEYQARAEWGTLDVNGVSSVSSDPEVLGSTGLLDEPDGLVIITGVNAGIVNLRTEYLLTPPGPPDESWEDVAELSIEPNGEGVFVKGPFDDVPFKAQLNPDHRSSLRLRVSARGRDVEFDLVASLQAEFYLVQAWPAPPSIPLSLRVSSETSRSWIAASRT